MELGVHRPPAAARDPTVWFSTAWDPTVEPSMEKEGEGEIPVSIYINFESYNTYIIKCCFSPLLHKAVHMVSLFVELSWWKSLW